MKVLDSIARYKEKLLKRKSRFQMPDEKKKSESEELSQKEQELQAQLQQAKQDLEQVQNKLKEKDQLEKEAQEKAEADKLAAESDIRELMKAETGVEDDKAEKINQLTNVQVLDVVSNAFETAIEGKAQLAMKEFGKQLVKVDERVDKIQNAVMQQVAVAGINAARGKFKDFDDYREDISKVLNQYPGIDIQDAYLLAKSHKAGDIPPKDQIDSEKPDVTMTRSRRSESTDESTGKKGERKEWTQESDSKSGIAGFRKILSSGLDRVLEGRKE